MRSTVLSRPPAVAYLFLVRWSHTPSPSSSLERLLRSLPAGGGDTRTSRVHLLHRCNSAAPRAGCGLSVRQYDSDELVHGILYHSGVAFRSDSSLPLCAFIVSIVALAHLHGLRGGGRLFHHGGRFSCLPSGQLFVVPV